jgi:hypothetical protein
MNNFVDIDGIAGPLRAVWVSKDSPEEAARKNPLLVNDKPTVEFYDLRGKQTPNGTYTGASYNADELLDVKGGLNLNIGVKDWKVPLESMSNVKAWIKAKRESEGTKIVQTEGKMDTNEMARKMADEGLVASLAEARRFIAAGVDIEKLKEMRKRHSEPLMARRDYGTKQADDGRKAIEDEARSLFKASALSYGRTVTPEIENNFDKFLGTCTTSQIKRAIDDIKGANVGATPRQADDEEADPEVVLKALMTEPELLKAVGAIVEAVKKKEWLALPIAQRIYGDLRELGALRNLAAADSDPTKILESIKNEPDFNETVMRLMNEHLVKNLSEARRLAAAGVTPEFLRHIRGERPMDPKALKERSSYVVKQLDVLADRLEAYGLREASEKLDIISNTIEATDGKPDLKDDLSVKFWEKYGEQITKIFSRTYAVINVDSVISLESLKNYFVLVFSSGDMLLSQLTELSKVLQDPSIKIASKGSKLALTVEVHDIDKVVTPKDAAALANKPYVVEQLEKVGFEVSQYPGSEEYLKELWKNKDPIQHHSVHAWLVSPPADRVFNVEGIEQENVILVTPGSAEKEQEGYFTGESPDDYKYLVMKASKPYKGIESEDIIVSSNREQDLISKLKRLLKPEGIAKLATKYLRDTPTNEVHEFLKKAGESVSFPIHFSDNPEHPELKRVFTWLTRHKMGPAFGSRPIGWYQQHQMAAIDIIEEAVKKAVGTGEVRVEKGDLMVTTNGRDWERLMSCEEVYKKADAAARK